MSDKPRDSFIQTQWRG